MTRLFSFGFEEEDELLALNSEQPEGTKIITAPFARTGKRVLELKGNNFGVSILWSHEPTEIFVSGAVRSNSTSIGDNWSIMRFGVGEEGNPFSQTAELRWRNNNILQIYRGGTLLATSDPGVCNPSNATVHLQVWFKPSNLGGRFVVKVEDVIVIDYTGDTTDNKEYCDAIQLRSIQDNDSYFTYWDDICINDSSGTINNSYPGLARLQPIKVVGAGSTTQLSRGGIDLGANYRQVRDSGDASFLQGSIDQLDLYTADVPDLPTGATIQNIIVLNSGKSAGGSGLIAPLVRGATTIGTGTDQALSSAGKSIQEAWPLNPDDSTAWDEADLANLQIGVKVRS